MATLTSIVNGEQVGLKSTAWIPPAPPPSHSRTCCLECGVSQHRGCWAGVGREPQEVSMAPLKGSCSTHLAQESSAMALQLKVTVLEHSLP